MIDHKNDSYLIAITGTDGVGKSTLCEKLVNKLQKKYPNQKIIEVSIWNVLKDSKQFRKKEDVVTHLHSLELNRRFEFLAGLFSKSLEKSLAENPDIIILNAYWYKYFASELCYGADHQELLKFLENFPTPNIVIELDLTAEEAWNRRQNASLYEQGLLIPGGRLIKNKTMKENFIEFQNRFKDKFELSQKLSGVSSWFKISASKDIFKLNNEVIAKISREKIKTEPHAIFLNPFANVGKGLKKWNSFLDSPISKKYSIAKLPLFSHPEKVTSASELFPHLCNWIYERASLGDRNFVAVGGDGTVNLTLNALLQVEKKLSLPIGELCLGAIGVGSSNDFHKPFSNKNVTKFKSIPYRLNFSKKISADVGELTINNSELKFFAVNSCIGAAASGGLLLQKQQGLIGKLKAVWVDGAIGLSALDALMNYKALNTNLKINGIEEKSTSLTNLSIVKNPHFAGSLCYDLDAKEDDGMFGVYLCENMNRKEILSTFLGLYKKKFTGKKKTLSVKSSRIEVEANKPFPVEFDGETVEANHVQFNILNQRLSLCR